MTFKFIEKQSPLKTLAEKIMLDMNLSKEDLQILVNSKNSLLARIIKEYLRVKHNNSADILVGNINANNKEEVVIRLAELKGRMKVAEDILRLPDVAGKILKEKIKSKK